MKKIASFLFLFIAIYAGYGQTDESVLQSIYNFEFQKAEEQLNSLPVDARSGNLHNLNYFLYLMSIQTRDAYSQYLEKTADLIREVKKESHSNDFHLSVFLFKSNLYRSVASGHFGDYSRAASYLIQAYRAQKEMNRINSAHPETRFSLALFEILSEQIPDRYQGVVNFSGRDDTDPSGYQSLKRLFQQYAGSGKSIEAESGFLWILFLWEFSDHPDELGSAWQIVNENSNLDRFLIMRYLGTMVGFKTGNTHLLEEIFEGLQPEAYARLPYFYYQRGKYRLLNLQPEGKGDMLRFLQTHENANFSRSAIQKIAWYYNVLEDFDQANYWYAKLLENELDETWADQQAIRETRKLRPYNSELLKIRMLYDAGHYSKCLDEAKSFLDASAGKTKAYQAELHYRIGRSLQGLGRQDEAMRSYSRVLNSFGDVENYIIPKSALLAAQICINHEQEERALTFLDLAELHNHYGYKSTFNRQIDALRRSLRK